MAEWLVSVTVISLESYEYLTMNIF